MLRSGWGARWPNAVEYKGLKPTVTQTTPTEATPESAQESKIDLSVSVLNYPGNSNLRIFTKFGWLDVNVIWDT